MKKLPYLCRNKKRKYMKTYKVEFIAYTIISKEIEIEDDENINDYIYENMDIDILDYTDDIHHSGVHQVNEIKEIDTFILV